MQTEILPIEKEERDTRIKGYGIVLGLITLVLQHAIYLLGHELGVLIGIPPILPKIPVIDDAIPLLPIFVIPYGWAYLFWAMAPMAVSKCKLDHFFNYLAAYLFACIGGAVILAFVPTYMDRVAEGLMDLPQDSFLNRFMTFFYTLDGGDMAYNLFPSFHCLNSTISYLGVRKREEIPRWFRIYSLVTAILVYAAAVCVKQHYFCDILGGIAVAVAAYVICVRVNAGRIFYGPMRLCQKIFRRAEK